MNRTMQRIRQSQWDYHAAHAPAFLLHSSSDSYDQLDGAVVLSTNSYLHGDGPGCWYEYERLYWAADRSRVRVRQGKSLPYLVAFGSDGRGRQIAIVNAAVAAEFVGRCKPHSVDYASLGPIDRAGLDTYPAWGGTRTGVWVNAALIRALAEAGTRD